MAVEAPAVVPTPQQEPPSVSNVTIPLLRREPSSSLFSNEKGRHGQDQEQIEGLAGFPIVFKLSDLPYRQIPADINQELFALSGGAPPVLIRPIFKDKQSAEPVGKWYVIVGEVRRIHLMSPIIGVGCHFRTQQGPTVWCCIIG
jgi:hypothetical protein